MDDGTTWATCRRCCCCAPCTHSQWGMCSGRGGYNPPRLLPVVSALIFKKTSVGTPVPAVPVPVYTRCRCRCRAPCTCSWRWDMCNARGGYNHPCLQPVMLAPIKKTIKCRHTCARCPCLRVVVVCRVRVVSDGVRRWSVQWKGRVLSLFTGSRVSTEKKAESAGTPVPACPYLRVVVVVDMCRVRIVSDVIHRLGMQWNLRGGKGSGRQKTEKNTNCFKFNMHVICSRAC